MKNPKKMAALLLSVLLMISFCGCADDGIVHGQTILAYEQATFLDATFDTVATLHYKLKDGCRDKMNLMFFVSTHNEGLNREQILVNDLYMLDLDTGTWYFDSMIDHDALYNGDSPNFETKENAMMFFFRAFDEARGEPFLWEESAKLDYLSVEEVARVNQMWKADQQARTLKTYTPKEMNLNLRQQRIKELQETVIKPAGWAKKSIDTMEEAIVYLNFRFPSVSAETMGETLRSGIEILEDHHAPVSATGVATSVAYLLGDDFDIQTLIAFSPDETGQSFVQSAINVIKTSDGYLFFDPVRLMSGAYDVHSDKRLPEMECPTIESYIEQIMQNTGIRNLIIVPNGERVDYTIENTDDFLIKTDSSAAVLIDCNTMS